VEGVGSGLSAGMDQSGEFPAATAELGGVVGNGVGRSGLLLMIGVAARQPLFGVVSTSEVEATRLVCILRDYS
jgi:hypothetical protein